MVASRTLNLHPLGYPRPCRTELMAIAPYTSYHCSNGTCKDITYGSTFRIVAVFKLVKDSRLKEIVRPMGTASWDNEAV